MTLGVGPLRDDERADALRLYLAAFPAAGPESVVSAPLERTCGMRDGSGLVGMAKWDVRDVSVRGVSLPMAVNAALTVRPSSRGHALLDGHWGTIHGLIRDSGCPLIGTQTHIFGFWKRLGWRWGAALCRHIGTPDQLRLTASATTGELTLQPHAADLAAVADEAGRTRFGLLRRSAEDWSYWVGAAAAPCGVAAVGWVGPEGALEGYLLFRLVVREPSLEVRSRRVNMIVEELVALSPDAYLGLLGFVAQQTTVSRFRWDAPADDRLPLHLASPQHIDSTVRPDKVMRILDVATLVLPAGSIDSAAVDGMLLDVDDDHLPWNRGFWRVQVDGAVVRFTRASAATGTPSPVPVGAIASLVSGMVSGEEAHAQGFLGRIGGSALAQLAELFPPVRAPYCPEPW